VGEHEGQQYYAMRYIEGTSLTRHPRAEARKEAGMLATVARAVYHAHQRGILHRDLKPSNILVDPVGVPYVADFGLAKRTDADRSLTESGALIGTPRYMAPEQAAGQKYLTVAADVYSLGVVLYERLTGQTPFNGATALEILQQVREAEPPRPSSLLPGLNRDVETICLKCLEKDPIKRYGSAEALAHDLERWLRGEAIEARPVSQAERLSRWCRRNPAVAGLVGAVLLICTLGTAVSSWFAVVADSREKEARTNARLADDKAADAARAREDAQAHLTRARSNLMTSQLRLVAGLIERDQSEALRLLHDSEACPEDLQDTAWRYYERQASRWIKITIPEVERLVTFSPDRKVAAFVGTDHTVKLWNCQTGHIHTAYRGPTEPIWAICFRSDGGLIFAEEKDHLLILRDTVTNQQCTIDPGKPQREELLRYALSEDGNLLASCITYDYFHNKATGRTSDVKIWKVAAGRAIDSFSHPGHVHNLAFCPDGSKLVVCGGIGVQLYYPVLAASTVGSFGCSSGQGSFLTVSTSEILDIPAMYRTVRDFSHPISVWNLNNRKLTVRWVKREEQLDWPEIALSRDGRTVVCGEGDGILDVFELGEPFAAKRFQTVGLRAASVAIALSSDGKRLAGTSRHHGVLSVWNAVSKAELRRFLCHAGVRDVQFGPDDGSLAILEEDNTLRVWDLAPIASDNTIRVGRGWENGVAAIAFHPAGRLLATASGWETFAQSRGGNDPCCVWDTNTGRRLAATPAREAFNKALQFLVDGQTIVIARFDKVTLWNPASNSERVLLPKREERYVHCVAVSPDGGDGGVIAIGGSENFLKLMVVTDGRTLADLLVRSSVNCVAFSPDGRLLTAGHMDRTVTVWDVASKQERHVLRGHTAPVTSIAFHPNGRILASASEDHTIRLWDTITSKDLHVLRGHTANVRSVAFSPDGKSLASGSDDKTVRLWDVATGHERAVISGRNAWISAVAFSPDGAILAIADEGDLRLIDLGAPPGRFPLQH
jgi:WD40 repeat protein